MKEREREKATRKKMIRTKQLALTMCFESFISNNSNGNNNKNKNSCNEEMNAFNENPDEKKQERNKKEIGVRFSCVHTTNIHTKYITPINETQRIAFIRILWVCILLQ